MAEISAQTCIVEYDQSHQEEVQAIVFPDLELILGLTWTPEAIEDYKSAFAEDDETVRKVLVDEGEVIGFADYQMRAVVEVVIIPPMNELCPGCTQEEAEGSMIAYIEKIEKEAPKYIDLNVLAISRGYRGKGFGKILLEYVETDARRRWPDMKLLKFAVGKENVRAQKFYKKLGFVRSDEQESGDFIHYEKAL